MKKFYFCSIITLFLFVLSFSSYAQMSCMADEMHQQNLQQNSAYAARFNQLQSQLRTYIAANPLPSAPTGRIYKIPLVVHVVHTGDTIGSETNPSIAQIEGLVAHLNNGFRNRGSAYNPNGIDTEIEFELAKRTPDCQPTNGIVRVDGSGIPSYTQNGISSGIPLTLGADELSVKNLSRWSNEEYYNIWLVNRVDGYRREYSIFKAGFTPPPMMNSDLDGSVILVSEITSIAIAPIHQVAHGFNLYHTFQGSLGPVTCPPNTDCTAQGDYVCDTSPHYRDRFQCNSNRCNSDITVLQNFMALSDCQQRFTLGQKQRMRASLETQRSGLLSSLALVPPSTLPTLACIPSFTPPTTNTGIMKVRFGSIDFVSGSAQQEGSYIDRTCKQGTIFSINTSQPIRIETGSSHRVRVYIDYNNDGDFDDSNEQILSSNSGSVHTGSTYIPSNAVLNQYLRMRVVASPTTSPYPTSCSVGSGQAEDYAVYIEDNSSCSITSVVAGTQGQCIAATNTFTQQVTVTYTDAPSTGDLRVNGQNFPITSSPQTVTLTGLPSNGNPLNIVASFTSFPSCSFTATNLITAPVSCLITIRVTPIPTSNPYCSNDNIEINFTTTGVFEPNNEFIVEMSDGNGGFTFPLISVRGTSSPIIITPPSSTSGSYRVRVRSTSPEIISPLSNSFQVKPAPRVNPFNPQQTAIVEGDSTTIVYSYADGAYYTLRNVTQNRIIGTRVYSSERYTYFNTGALTQTTEFELIQSANSFNCEGVVGRATVLVYPRGIMISANGYNIFNTDYTPTLQDNTQFGSREDCNNVTKEFVIKNSSSSPLILTELPFMGGNTDFYVSRPPSSNTVPANDSLTFEVTYLPTHAGIQNDTVVVRSNDAANGEYKFLVQASSSSGFPEHQIDRLVGSDSQMQDLYGQSVSVFGEYAVVGAPKADGQTINSGAAYIYKREVNNWIEQAKIQANDGQTNDEFGFSVAIEEDYILVGAPSKNAVGSSSGVVYIFKKDGANWIQHQKIQSQDLQAGDAFGYSLDISGERAVIGAYKKDAVRTDAGAAYIFKRNGTSWTQEAKLVTTNPSISDYFGFDVGISGDHVIVGAPQKAYNSMTNSGLAYVFERNGTTWFEQSRLVAEYPKSGDKFGQAVDIDGTYAVVGVPSDGTITRSGPIEIAVVLDCSRCANIGYIQIYRNEGTQWTLSAKYRTALPRGNRENNYLGFSVAISGDYVVAGANGVDLGGNNVGSISMFQRNSFGWRSSIYGKHIQAKDQEVQDAFGTSVAIFGNQLFVGATQANSVTGTNTGKVYAFTASAGELQIVDNGTIVAAGDTTSFGQITACENSSVIKTLDMQSIGCETLLLLDNPIVTISGSDDFEIVNQPTQNSMTTGSSQSFQVAYTPNQAGSQYAVISIKTSSVIDSVYTFTLHAEKYFESQELGKFLASDTQMDDQFGTDVAISGRYAIVGAPYESSTAGTLSGAAYIFKKQNNSWIEQAKLQSSDLEMGDNFGFSVAITRDYAIVGANREDTGGSDVGAAYIFKKDANGDWLQEIKLQPTDLTNVFSFGEVAISENYAAVGATMSDGAGRVYVFENVNGTWTQTHILEASDKTAGDNFGVSVAISNQTILVGSSLDDDVVNASGSAYFFTKQGNNWIEESKITASDELEGFGFGHSVDISGDRAVIGNNYVGGNSEDLAAYVFKRDSTIWTQEAKLQSTLTSSHFGRSVAIKDTSVLIGAPYDNTTTNQVGAVYSFSYRDSVWSENQKLQPPVRTAQELLYLGHSVALDNDFVIGAIGDYENGGLSGAVYVLTPSLIRLSVQGNSITIADKDSIADVADNTDFGTINACETPSLEKTFTLHSIGCDSITFTAPLSIVLSDSSSFSVSMQPLDSMLASGQSQEFKITYSPTPTLTGIQRATVSILSNDPNVDPYSFTIQGESAVVTGSLTVEGNAVRITNGETQTDSLNYTNFGSVEACQLTTLERTFKLYGYGSECNPLTLTGSEPVTIFGSADFEVISQPSLSTLNIGDTTSFTIRYSPNNSAAQKAIVSIASDNPNVSPYTFAIQAEADFGLPITQITKLRDRRISNDISLIGSGYAVDLVGEYAARGSYSMPNGGANRGVVYVYKREGRNWIEDALITNNDPNLTTGGFGHEVLLTTDNYLFVSSLGTSQGGGAVFVFKREGNQWTRQAVLQASDVSNNNFGVSLAIQDNYLVVGASNASSGSTDGGAAYVFKREGSTWTQEAKLTSSTAYSGDNIGGSVSIEGDYILIGASQTRTSRYSSNNVGAVYLFKKEGNDWIEKQKLFSPRRITNDFFGSNVKLSNGTAFVTAVNDDTTLPDAGAVYTFKIQNDELIQESIIQIDTPLFYHRFGSSLDVAGNVLAVGAVLDDEFGTDAGAVYLFNKENDIWIQKAKIKAEDTRSNAGFGTRVALSGKNMIVSNVYHRQNAYIFQTNTVQLTVEENYKLLLTNDTIPDYNSGVYVGTPDSGTDFGLVDLCQNGSAPLKKTFILKSTGCMPVEISSVSVEGSTDFSVSVASNSIAGGDSTVLTVTYTPTQYGIQKAYISIFNNDPQVNEYRFAVQGTGATLMPSNENQQKVTATDGARFDQLGGAVAISGNYAIAGASSANSSRGAVYIYKKENNVWIEQTKLTIPNASFLTNFGYSVAIDGEYAVVGARNDRETGTRAGAVYVFKRDGNNWIQQARLEATNRVINDYFGSSVSISGNYIIVGAENKDINGTKTGAAYIYKRTGTTWTLQTELVATDGQDGDKFGTSVSIYGNHAVVGASNVDNFGVVYAYKLENEEWTLQNKIISPQMRYQGEFGAAVDVENGYLVIGAPKQAGGYYNSGTAWVYKYDGYDWREHQRLSVNGVFVNTMRNSLFGNSVSISNNYIIVGAKEHLGRGNQSGNAYVYRRSRNEFYNSYATQVIFNSIELTSDSVSTGDYFGFSVAIDGDNAIVGAVGDDQLENASGAVYFFAPPPTAKLILKGDTTFIANNDTIPSLIDNTDFGSTCQTTITKTFTIQNEGTSDLTIAQGDITGTDASDFVINSITFPLVISPSASQDFDIEFSSTSEGIKNATVTFVSDACGSPTSNFVFAIKAEKNAGNLVPSIIAANDTTVFADLGNCTASNVALTLPTVINSCSGLNSLSNDAPSIFDLGTTIVTWTVVDLAGNTATATQNITVVDNQNPTILAASDTTIFADLGNCTASNVMLTLPSISDNCTLDSLTNDAPSVFDLGTTTVTWTVVDLAGNTATATQNVTIVDNQVPIILVANDTTIQLGLSNCNVSNVVLTLPIISDNCTLDSLTNDVPSSYNVGTTTITWTVVDLAGNTATATQNVTIVDNQNPTILAANDTTIQADLGNCTASNVTLTSPTVSDNCTINTVSNDAPSVFDLGTTNVIWTVTDAAGNTATASQNVTIVDNQNPTILAANDTTIQADLRNCTASNITLTSPTVSDNCTINTVSNDAPSVFDLGTTSVIWTVTDAAGNTATATQNVTIIPSIELTYSSTTFNEENTNLGIIENSITINSVPCGLFGGTNGEDFVNTGKVIIRNLPNGLIASITRQNESELVFTLTDTATSHQNIDDIANLEVEFLNTAFAGTTTQNVTNYLKNDLIIDFIDAVSIGGGTSTGRTSPVTNLTLSNITTSQIFLNWRLPNGTVTGYRIYRGNQLIATLTNPNTTSYLDENLNADTYFTYKVIAFNQNNESEPAQASGWTFPKKPILISVTELCTEGKAIAKVTSSGFFYKIYQDSSSNTVLFESNDASFELPFITQNTTFYVSVISHNQESRKTAIEVIVNPAFEVTISEGDSLISCEATQTLNVSNPNQEDVYIWFLNGIEIGVGENIEVTQTGNYKVRGMRGNCFAFSTPTFVKLNAFPTAQIVQGQTVNFCESGTINALVSSNQNTTYNWYLDGNLVGEEESINVENSGTYTLKVTQNNCQSETNIEVRITNHPQIPILTTNNTSICPNEETTLRVSNVEQNVTYVWSRNGRVILNTTDSLITSIAGNYQVRAINNSNLSCLSTSEVFVIERLEVAPTYLRKNDSTLLLQSSDSIVNVVWYLEGYILTEWNDLTEVNYTQNGNYSALVTYQTGCQFQTQTTFARTPPVVVGIEEPNLSDSFKIYPNPSANGIFTIHFGNILTKDIQIDIFDAVGRKISSATLIKNQQDFILNLEGKTSGLYMIQFYAEGATYSKQIIIAK